MALSDSAGVGGGLPSQAGITSGYVLSTDGTQASWNSVAGSIPLADGTHAGAVSLATQTMGAGLKTFTEGIKSFASGGVLSGKFGVSLLPGIWMGTGSDTPSDNNFLCTEFSNNTYFGSKGNVMYFMLGGNVTQGLKLDFANRVADFSDLGVHGGPVGMSIKMTRTDGTVVTLTVNNSNALVIS